MTCSEIPDILVALYRNITSGNLLAFLGLISATFIPFAIFLIEGNDKTDAEKDLFKVERVVILKHVMHTRLLVSSLFIGGIASLLFLDNAKCEAGYLITNAICGFLYLFSIIALLIIMRDTVRWISTSAKASDTKGFRFKKWKTYLKSIKDKDFHETWQKVFGSNTIPALLQPAYLSIFLEQANKQKDLDKYRSLSILRKNITNINISSPDVLEVIINTLSINHRTVQLLSDICDALVEKEDVSLFFCLLDRKIAKEDTSKIKTIINSLIFGKLVKYFNNNEALTGLLSGIPNNWKIDSLLVKNEPIPTVMAEYYLSWITKMINRQEKDPKIALEKIDCINNALVGDPMDENIDKKLLADFCEIYGYWCELTNLPNNSLFEEQIIDNYVSLEARHFAIFTSYTAYGEVGEKPNYEPSIRRKTLGTIKLLRTLFPQFINNSEHLARMKKKINARLKDNPDNYRLKKLKGIYRELDTYSKKQK